MLSPIFVPSRTFAALISNVPGDSLHCHTPDRPLFFYNSCEHIFKSPFLFSHHQRSFILHLIFQQQIFIKFSNFLQFQLHRLIRHFDSQTSPVIFASSPPNIFGATKETCRTILISVHFHSRLRHLPAIHCQFPVLPDIPSVSSINFSGFFPKLYDLDALFFPTPEFFF